MKTTIFISLSFFYLSDLFGQPADAIVYEGWYNNGQQYSLYIGQSITFTSTSGPSVDINSANAGVKIRRISGMTPCTPLGVSYPEKYFYTEIDQPLVGGTDQYSGELLEATCVLRYIPQPNLFIPIDWNNGHPNVSHPAILPTNANAGDTMLMIRKANFWENSEDVCGLHGPYGELLLNRCSLSVMQYSYLDLVNYDSLWHPLRIGMSRNIYGHAYTDVWSPDPYNEWIDNWWGAYYSNCAMWNWSNTTLNSIAIIISEADDPFFNLEDVLGRAVIDQNMTGCILVKCRMFGWIVLENVIIPASGNETSVDVADSYVFLNWNGDKAEDYDGSQNNRMGTQYNPFNTMQQVEDSVPNTIVGVLDDGWIHAPNDLTVPMTYIPAAPTLCETYSYIIDWNGTVNTVINEISTNKFDFNVFPNPFKDQINIEFNSTEIFGVMLEIYDVLGNLIKSQKIKSKNTSIDMSEINSGIYFLNLRTEKNKIIKKLIKL